jgi:Ca2+-transporting ATPase/Ca2+ transporting ATPase
MQSLNKLVFLRPSGLSVEGENFRKLSPRELDANSPSTYQVLARSSPEDKHILVQRLNGGLIA